MGDSYRPRGHEDNRRHEYRDYRDFQPNGGPSRNQHSYRRSPPRRGRHSRSDSPHARSPGLVERYPQRTLVQYEDGMEDRRSRAHGRENLPMHYFGSDSSRFRDFSFKPGDAPRYPQHAPPFPRNENEAAQRRYRRHDERFDGRNNRHGPRRDRPRGPLYRHKTSERPLLTRERDSTPPLLVGMNGEVTGGTKKFLNPDDLSDSDEVSMEESDVDEGVGGGGSDSGDTEPPVPKRDTKLAATEAVEKPQPKWSNPEVYTSLPPMMEENNRKKKDIVKMIRKARVDAAQEEADASKPAALQDFLSFDFLEDNAGPKSSTDPALAAAPTEPKAMGPTLEMGSFTGGLTALPQSLAGQDANTVSALGRLGNLKEDNKLRAEVQELASNGCGTNPPDPLGELGQNRKRKRDTADDELEILTAPVYKKGRGERPTGKVLSHWLDVGNHNTRPWLTEEVCSTDEASSRLHSEIISFVHFVRPRAFEHKIRGELLERLQNAVTRWNPSATVCPFGSFPSGLFLPNADMDIVLTSRTYNATGIKTLAQSSNQMHKLGNTLVMSGVALPESVEVIGKARVPLVKYIDRITRIRVDVSFENSTGIIANGTYQRWKSQFPSLPAMAFVIKQLLLMRGLNEVPTGGIGGFSITCLIVNLLNSLPRGRMNDQPPYDHLGDLLLEFLDFYGSRLDIGRVAIRMEPPGLVEKRFVRTSKLSKLDRFTILDPNDESNDISGGSSETGLIRECFSRTRAQIISAMATNEQSFLEGVLGGNYNDFLWHRRKLRTIYEERYGPIDSDDE